MSKLLRSRKQFGRCSYHGQKCEVAEEINQTAFTRAQEHKEIENEISSGLDELMYLNDDIDDV